MMTVCLTMLLIVAQIDKTIIALLIEPIKHDLQMTDLQVSLIIGSAFALANIAATLPAGWLTDRFDRQAIVQAGVGIWSAMTILCGGAGTFGALFAARAGVGLGEGLLPPAAFSLIRDGVSLERRGRAFAMFSSASSFGSGLSLLIGGGLIALAYHSGITHIPLFGKVEPWQITLIMIGVAGFPLSLLIWAFPKPPRATGPDAEGVSIRSAWAEAMRNKRLYVPLLCYSVAHASIASTFALWIPAFTARRLGLQPVEIGLTLGILLVCVAPVGVLSLGVLIDRMGAGAIRKIATLTCFIAGAAAIIAITLPFSTNMVSFWILQGSSILMSSGFLTITSTIVSQTSTPRAIGKILSIFLLMQALVGGGIAPTCVGLLSDTLFAGAPFPLALALSTVAGSFGAIAFIGALFLRRAAGNLPGQGNSSSISAPALTGANDPVVASPPSAV